MQAFSAYAPPLIWGPEIIVLNHLGKINAEISFSAEGDTLVIGRVKYFKDGDDASETIEEFTGSISITTSNSVATVRCDFKGIVTGSPVTVTVLP